MSLNWDNNVFECSDALECSASAASQLHLRLSRSHASPCPIQSCEREKSPTSRFSMSSTNHDNHRLIHNPRPRLMERAFQRASRRELVLEILEQRSMLAANTLVPTMTNTAPPESKIDATTPFIMGPFEQRAPSLSNLDSPFNANAVLGYSTVIDNGPSSNRVDIVILGDGYRAEEIDTTYVTHSTQMLDYLFNSGQDPFPRYAEFFNAHLGRSHLKRVWSRQRT